MITSNPEAQYFRTFGAESDSPTMRHFLQQRLSLDDNAYEAIVDHLKARAAEVRGKDTFGIVYDITRFCNLQCAHCCVNAKLTTYGQDSKFETTTSEALSIIRHVYEYTSIRHYPNVFLIFGGGEPTLRPDFPEIASVACDLFGQAGVGMNSNGTTLTVDELKVLSTSLGFIEISIDGFEEYHNAWRDPKQHSAFPNPYQKTLALVRDAVQDEDLAEKLEVSSAVTTDNLSQLRAFAEYLAEIGVRHYSIHRAMPVGRMGRRIDRIPSMQDYIKLLLDIAWVRENTSMRTLHVHHSLETIYSVLFLGYDIHKSDLLAGSGRHSIGIDPDGYVYFDPWCVVPPFNKLAAGKLLGNDANLERIVEQEGSLIRLADEIAKHELRCRACRMNCSGGMRFNALGHFLFSRFGDKIETATETDMIAGLSEIDPACPLYDV